METEIPYRLRLADLDKSVCFKYQTSLFWEASMLNTCTGHLMVVKVLSLSHMWQLLP